MLLRVESRARSNEALGLLLLQQLQQLQQRLRPRTFASAAAAAAAAAVARPSQPRTGAVEDPGPGDAPGGSRVAGTKLAAAGATTAAAAAAAGVSDPLEHTCEGAVADLLLAFACGGVSDGQSQGPGGGGGGVNGGGGGCVGAALAVVAEVAAGSRWVTA